MARDGAILVLKTGEALPSVKARFDDFEAWIAKGVGVSISDLVLASAYAGEPLPDPASIGGVIVTGSPAMVSAREDWSEAAAAWLAPLVENDALPVLGICYGHQLIAHGLGGQIRPNPNGREMGTVETRLDAAALATDPVLNAGVYPTHMSHVESVVVPPSDAQVLGTTEIEPHAALRFGPRQWGVQYHPEFDREIMRGYVEARRDILAGEGLDPDGMLESAVETPEATGLLRRFAEVVASV